jgi:hypothetical protein
VKPQKVGEVIGPLLNLVAGGGVRQEEAASRPSFDADAALARFEGNCELLRRMVGVFALQWRQLSAESVKASQHHDGPMLELTANRLRQSLTSFGAGAASRVAQELERCGREGDFRGADMKSGKLKTEIERFVDALKEVNKESGGHRLTSSTTERAAPPRPREARIGESRRPCVKEGLGFGLTKEVLPGQRAFSFLPRQQQGNR